MKWLKHDFIKLNISEHITRQIKILTNEDFSLDEIYSLWSAPPEIKMGHQALAMFPIAKRCKTNPAELAKKLQVLMEKIEIIGVMQWMAVGPYLNFFYNHGDLYQSILPSILKEDFFKQRLSQDFPKTMIEFSQPNTHKELHVGHMRNLCLGDSLIKILRYLGGDIISSTFPGDVGTHVAKCLWFYKYHYKGIVPSENKGAWLGHLYTLAHNRLEDERGTPEEATNREHLTEILKQLEKKQGEYFELWKETRQWSIDLMKEVYHWANVKFDVWYWESEVDSASVELVKDYQQKGLFVESEGAVGIDLKEYKLGFCLLLKTDGNGLYATKDIELARRKFQDFKVQKSLYVVDKRQSHHFEQVFKCLELMGFPQAKDCIHLQYDFVELPDGAMSSRKGNIVPLQKLIKEMEVMIKEQYLNRYQGQWTQDEIEKTATQVAKGAIKYGMTKIDPQKKIVFDMKEWLKLDGESGPYIQYAYARIQSMLLKVKREAEPDYKQMTTPQEQYVIRLLKEFNQVIIESGIHYKPSLLTAYLFDLTRSYNAFYAECNLMNSPAGLKEARMDLSLATSLCLKYGLELLGIEAPLKM